MFPQLSEKTPLRAQQPFRQQEIKFDHLIYQCSIVGLSDFSAFCAERKEEFHNDA
jgi:hypothetical protein